MGLICILDVVTGYDRSLSGIEAVMGRDMLSHQSNETALPCLLSKARSFFQLLFQSQTSWQGDGVDRTVGWHIVVTNLPQAIAGSASTV